MKKTLSLVLAMLMLLCGFAVAEEPAAEEAPAPVVIEAVTVYQAFDGENVEEAFEFMNPDCDSTATLVEGQLVVPNEFWTEWTQVHVLPQAEGTLAGADGIMFYLKRQDVTVEKGNFNFTIQIGSEGETKVEKEYVGETLWYKADGTEEWVELPFYGGWGSNFPVETAGWVYLPFDGFIKTTSGGGELDLTNVKFVQFWLNTYGAQHGSVVIDAMGGAVKQ